MGIPRLIASGFERRIETASRPFTGLATGLDGNARRVCVKPMLTGRPNWGLTLAAEIVGAAVAGLLEVPVPKVALVSIDADFIQAAGGQLSDVESGWAVASEWVENAVPAAGIQHLAARIVNRDSIAGVTVLDTLLQNTDRHPGNVLLAAVDVRPNADLRLSFIDNAYALNSQQPKSVNVFSSRPARSRRYRYGSRRAGLRR